MYIYIKKHACSAPPPTPILTLSPSPEKHALRIVL